MFLLYDLWIVIDLSVLSKSSTILELSSILDYITSDSRGSTSAYLLLLVLGSI